MGDERQLELTASSYQLIVDAQAAFDAAQRHRDTVLRATFAAAGIGDATVLRVVAVGESKVLHYTTPVPEPAKP